MKISIILPAYNEELTIKDVITSFKKHLPQAYIYIIDNNSSDNTTKIAKATLKKLKAKGDVFFVKEQGKANAIRFAFSHIDSDIYVMSDADMTYPASEIKKLIQPVIDNQADMAVGDRLSKGIYTKENKRKFHNLGNNLVKKMINVIFKAKLKDIMTGYRVFNKKFVKTYPILVEGFELETDLTIHALDKRLRIVEVPIEYIDRPEGSESKLNTYVDGFKVVTRIFKLFKNYKPFYFFGLISTILFLAGLACGTPVIIEFIKSSFIKHVPLAILATGLMILAFLFLTIALILDTIAKNHKFNFELQLVEFDKK